MYVEYSQYVQLRIDDKAQRSVKRTVMSVDQTLPLCTLWTPDADIYG